MAQTSRFCSHIDVFPSIYLFPGQLPPSVTILSDKTLSSVCLQWQLEGGTNRLENVSEIIALIMFEAFPQHNVNIHFWIGSIFGSVLWHLGIINSASSAQKMTSCKVSSQLCSGFIDHEFSLDSFSCLPRIFLQCGLLQFAVACPSMQTVPCTFL